MKIHSRNYFQEDFFYDHMETHEWRSFEWKDVIVPYIVHILTTISTILKYPIFWHRRGIKCYSFKSLRWIYIVICTCVYHYGKASSNKVSRIAQVVLQQAFLLQQMLIYLFPDTTHIIIFLLNLLETLVNLGSSSVKHLVPVLYAHRAQIACLTQGFFGKRKVLSGSGTTLTENSDLFYVNSTATLNTATRNFTTAWKGTASHWQKNMCSHFLGVQRL